MELPSWAQPQAQIESDDPESAQLGHFGKRHNSAFVRAELF
jgi:hypothetical protein